MARDSVYNTIPAWIVRFDAQRQHRNPAVTRSHTIPRILSGTFALLLVVGLLAADYRATKADTPTKVEPATKTATPAPADKLLYNRDVRPILAENCFACHGPDSAARKAGLRIDQRDAAIAKGAIVPGKPTESDLLTRIFLAESEEGAMPPKKSHEKLTTTQKDILKRWVV